MTTVCCFNDCTFVVPTESQTGIAESCINFPSAVFSSSCTSSPLINLYKNVFFIHLCKNIQIFNKKEIKKITHNCGLGCSCKTFGIIGVCVTWSITFSVKVTFRSMVNFSFIKFCSSVSVSFTVLQTSVWMVVFSSVLFSVIEMLPHSCTEFSDNIWLLVDSTSAMWGNMCGVCKVSSVIPA